MSHKVQTELGKRFGMNLKMMLKERNIKQVEFAAMLNVDPSCLRRWLSGNNNKLDVCELCAKVLGVSTKDIIFG